MLLQVKEAHCQPQHPSTEVFLLLLCESEILPSFLTLVVQH